MSLIFLKCIGLLLSGSICGFISSSPPGPINLLIADSVIGVRALHQRAFIIGVILAELFLAAIAFWGYHRFYENPVFQKWAPLVGGILVTGLGVAGFFVKEKRGEEGKEEKRYSGRKKSGDLLQGLFLCGSNPAFLVFWIYVMSALSYSGLAQGIPMKSIYLLMGIAIGNLAWFILFIHYLKLGVDRLKGTLPWLRKGISLMLIILGLSGVFIFL